LEELAASGVLSLGGRGSILKSRVIGILILFFGLKPAAGSRVIVHEGLGEGLR
jgi:hypothetical protein